MPRVRHLRTGPYPRAGRERQARGLPDLAERELIELRRDLALEPGLVALARMLARLSCHVAPFGHPIGADPERFHLIASYETDPRKWLALPWIDQYSGKQYRISTTLATSTRQIARVKSYGDVLDEYEFHEEAKCADASGVPCDKRPRAAATTARNSRMAATLHRQGVE